MYPPRVHGSPYRLVGPARGKKKYRRGRFHKKELREKKLRVRVGGGRDALVYRVGHEGRDTDWVGKK